MPVIKSRINGHLVIIPATSDNRPHQGVLLDRHSTQVIGAISFVKMEEGGKAIDPAKIVGAYRHGVVAVSNPLPTPQSIAAYVQGSTINKEVRQALVHLNREQNFRRGGSRKPQYHRHHTHS